MNINMKETGFNIKGLEQEACLPWAGVAREAGLDGDSRGRWSWLHWTGDPQCSEHVDTPQPTSGPRMGIC